MLTGICNLSVIPMRSEASHKAEMTNQILFGESFIIDKVKSEWSQVTLIHDSYSGWIENKQFTEFDSINDNYYVCNKLNEKISINNSEQQLVLGSLIPLSIDMNNKLKLKLQNKPKTLVKDDVKKISLKYLNSPYLWGGRTPLGIDCSGLVQMVFRQLGYKFPRDSHEQEKVGNTINNLNYVKTGDLAFFGEKKITHVGIILEKNTIIHASGKVKIDSLNSKGIIDENKICTHKLKSIKRVI
jgi:hypothetical protein